MSVGWRPQSYLCGGFPVKKPSGASEKLQLYPEVFGFCVFAGDLSMLQYCRSFEDCLKESVKFIIIYQLGLSLNTEHFRPL